MDYVGKSVGYVGKSVGYAAITHTFQPMKSIRSEVPWYKNIYIARLIIEHHREWLASLADNIRMSVFKNHIIEMRKRS